MNTDHAKFQQILGDSTRGVAEVACWLTRMGQSVMMPGLHIAPTVDVRDKYTDSGDLFVLKRQEIKTLTREFTGESDWPFGKHFIVCSKGSFEKMKPQPENFIILSKGMKHAAIINLALSKKHWYEEMRTNNYNNNVTFLFCPLHLVKWYKL